MAYDCAYEIFNLGNSQPVSLTKMIETIEQAIGKRARIRRLPEQPGDVPLTYADISKAGKLLGYCPTTSFEQGIRRYVDWHCAQAQSSRLHRAAAND
jgi:UDP-glucuronate 4-epimerase